MNAFCPYQKFRVGCVDLKVKLSHHHTYVRMCMNMHLAYSIDNIHSCGKL